MSNPDIDPSIWKACAGNLVQIPTVGSRVYYFPQGHAEHCFEASSPLRNLGFVKPYYLSRIDSVKLLADSNTEEVYAKIGLRPIESIGELSHDNQHDNGIGGIGGIGEERAVVSFAKVLTASDANNGGGFSVPRFCAESIFPGLNFEEDPPVQTIGVSDVGGKVWTFRHIYRGTPRRHLLTTGWSKFVNSKKLVAGDSAVFMRNGEGELFVGIKRSERRLGGGGGGGGGGSSSSSSSSWECDQIGGKVGECRKEEGFSRGSSRRISGQAVVEAVGNAAAGRGFEVNYYPNAGLPEFVVRAEVVETSLSVAWRARMRFKMAMESEDASRVAWFHGAVSSVAVPDHGPFRGSPWRMLQVTWDEPAVLQNIKRVSPWQIELVEATPPYNPAKRLRVSNDHELLLDGQGLPMFPAEFANSMMGTLNFFHPNSSPAGMQGARHDTISVSDFSNFFIRNSWQMLPSNHVYGNTAPQLSSLSTDLHNVNTSQSDNSSPGSESSVQLSDRRAGNSMTRAAVSSSIQLFGRVIHVNQPVDTGSDDGGGIEDDGGKQCDAADGLY